MTSIFGGKDIKWRNTVYKKDLVIEGNLIANHTDIQAEAHEDIEIGNDNKHAVVVDNETGNCIVSNILRCERLDMRNTEVWSTFYNTGIIFTADNISATFAGNTAIYTQFNFSKTRTNNFSAIIQIDTFTATTLGLEFGICTESEKKKVVPETNHFFGQQTLNNLVNYDKIKLELQPAENRLVIYKNDVSSSNHDLTTQFNNITSDRYCFYVRYAETNKVVKISLIDAFEDNVDLFEESHIIGQQTMSFRNHLNVEYMKQNNNTLTITNNIDAKTKDLQAKKITVEQHAQDTGIFTFVGDYITPIKISDSHYSLTTTNSAVWNMTANSLNLLNYNYTITVNISAGTFPAGSHVFYLAEFDIALALGDVAGGNLSQAVAVEMGGATPSIAHYIDGSQNANATIASLTGNSNVLSNILITITDGKMSIFLKQHPGSFFEVYKDLKISKNTFYASIRKIDGVGSSSIDCNIQIVQTEQVRDLVYKKEDFKLDYRKNLNFVSNTENVVEMTESEFKISNDKKLSINVPNRVYSFNSNNTGANLTLTEIDSNNWTFAKTAAQTTATAYSDLAIEPSIYNYQIIFQNLSDTTQTATSNYLPKYYVGLFKNKIKSPSATDIPNTNAYGGSYAIQLNKEGNTNQKTNLYFSLLYDDSKMDQTTQISATGISKVKFSIVNGVASVFFMLIGTSVYVNTLASVFLPTFDMTTLNSTDYHVGVVDIDNGVGSLKSDVKITITETRIDNKNTLEISNNTVSKIIYDTELSYNYGVQPVMELTHKDITMNKQLIYRSLTLANLIFLSKTNTDLLTVGGTFYCSDLKELLMWVGDAWKILSGNPQKIKVATTYYTKQYSTNTNFANINNSFETTFIVLSPNYRFRFYCHILDSDSASQYFEARIVRDDSGTPLQFSDTIIVSKFDRTDEITLLIDFFKSGLTIGDSYKVNIQARTTIANDTITIKSGQNSATEIYPKSYFEIKPLYNVSTF